MASLDPSPAELESWGQAALKVMTNYLGQIREKRVYPSTTAADIRQKLDRTLPIAGTSFEQLLGTFSELVESSRQNGHPRMFGYVQSPGTAMAALADLLASTLNANLTAWRSAPAATELERLTIDWMRQIMGYGEGAAGLFVSGGSMANFAALTAARRAKAPSAFAEQGARASDKAMRIYISEETHHSIAKAAALLGIGNENVRTVAVDEKGRMRIDQLVGCITEDIEAGHLPFFVGASAGTVAAGAVDPLRQISEVARRFNLWMHVDGAYGGFAIVAEGVRSLFEGINEADSIALDPHKWLYLPLDCGCILYRQAEFARATFAHDAEYTRVIGQQADEAFAFWDYGPELSRRFRALKVWMVLKGVGMEGLRAAIENDLACARYLERLVQESGDFEMVAPVELSIVCFRYLPASFRSGSKRIPESKLPEIEAALERFNEKLLLELQRDGHSYLSNAKIGGRFALRGCVMNYRTTLRDMEILLADLRRVATQITEEPGP
jgi:aromatic-L-amino-acid/L-tryptophan decarboxylase